jgi:hypothetical protein
MMNRIIALLVGIAILAGCSMGDWSGRNTEALANIEIARIQADAQVAVATTQANAQVATTRMWVDVLPLLVSLFVGAIVAGMLIARNREPAPQAQPWFMDDRPMIVHIHQHSLERGDAEDEPYFDEDRVVMLPQARRKQIQTRR